MVARAAISGEIHCWLVIASAHRGGGIYTITFVKPIKYNVPGANTIYVINVQKGDIQAESIVRYRPVEAK